MPASAAILANTHIHLPPNFSAFTTVADTVDTAAEEGIAVLGVSNYYDFTCYAEFDRRAEAAGILPLHGLEIISLDTELQAAGTKVNDPGNPGRFYLCGKGIARYAPLDPDAAAGIDWIRASDTARMAEMAQRMEHAFAAAGTATGLDAEAIRAEVARSAGADPATVVLQERHIARAFEQALRAAVPAEAFADAVSAVCGAPVAATDPAGVQNALRSHLKKAGKPAYAPERFVDFPTAYGVILALGGIPSYPTLVDGANPICPFEADLDVLVAELRARGIHAAELIPIRNTPEVLARTVHAFRAAGLIVTAGTEHNTPDRIPLAPRCAGGAPIPDDVQAIFLEGACVVAAHEELVRRGEDGYVLRDGTPNPAWPDAESRIAALAALGALTIAAVAR
ncbi:MAG: hypothetical protein ACKO5K_04765 [Armatimonadota bacterium]